MSTVGVVVDSSAIVAILFEEEEHAALRSVLARAATRLVSAATLLETRIVLFSRSGEEGLAVLDALIARTGMVVAPVDERLGDLAFDVYRRFGKGAGNPAILNFGDCFSLALAEMEGLPLLYKGNDFSRCGVPRAG